MAAAIVLAACGGGGGEAISTTTEPQRLPLGPAGPVAPTTTTMAASGGPAAGAASGTQAEAPWPAPTRNVSALIRQAGLPALDGERFEYHIHSHIDVFVDGRSYPVPADLGIDLAAGRISPLHTHDDTGIVHVEAEAPATFTLGQFFTQWDVRLDNDCIGAYCRPATPVEIYVDGFANRGDPRQIQFTRHRQIAIVIGRPPATIPSRYDFPEGL